MTTEGSVSNSLTFANPDLVTSQGITFRDPETGALYVQTQLLQVRTRYHFMIYFSEITCYCRFRTGIGTVFTPVSVIEPGINLEQSNLTSD